MTKIYIIKWLPKLLFPKIKLIYPNDLSETMFSSAKYLFELKTEDFLPNVFEKNSLTSFHSVLKNRIPMQN